MLLRNAKEPPGFVQHLVREAVRNLRNLHHSGDREGNSERLLQLYAAKYPEAPTESELKEVVQRVSNAPTEIHRLNDKLKECFLRDRALWKDQRYLLIPPKERGGRASPLSTKPLSDLLKGDPGRSFWFHQALRLGRGDKATPSFLVFAEPLFFYCNSLRAYIRFLDVNHDGTISDSDAKELLDQARIMISQRPRADTARFDSSSTSQLLNELDLAPVRHYLPAGDSYTVTNIRAFFRSWLGIGPVYREVRKISSDDEATANLIVVGNARSTRLIRTFQNAKQELHVRLTDTGIALDGEMVPDRVGQSGLELAHVVVTNWVQDTGNVFTSIASNHTRAVDAVSTRLLEEPVDILTDESLIPERFQLAYEVTLRLSETTASEVRVLPRLGGRALIYP